MAENKDYRYSIDETISIEIIRHESNFDRACEQAKSSALNRFGVNDYGHFENVKDALRSECFIEIKFISYW